MRKNVLLTILFVLIITACARLLEGDPLPVEVGDYKPPISDTVKLTADVGLNDPKSLGLAINCSASDGPEYKKIEIIDSLPVRFDLSKDMPPVKSQGIVGSCASFATTYYMKSYQEKIQHKYEYNNYSKVMSPSYVYNQVKVSDCPSGSCIINNLSLLKREGAATWQEFPYDGVSCFLQPNSQHKKLAEKNKIKAYYNVSSTDSTNINYTKIKAIKSLLYNKIPVIIGMSIDKDFSEGDKKSDSVFVYNSYDASKPYGRHGMLIVGYDDRLNAFKVINSWGTSWGNKGYSYINYDFFDNTNENSQYVPEIYYAEDL